MHCCTVRICAYSPLQADAAPHPDCRESFSNHLSGAVDAIQECLCSGMTTAAIPSFALVVHPLGLVHA